MFRARNRATIGCFEHPAGLQPRTGDNGRELMVHALRLTGLLAAAAVAVVPPSAGIAQVLMQRDVSLKMALTIAEAAVGACEKAGNNVSVAVVDRAGRLRVFLQGDKAAPHNIELAQRKALTTFCHAILNSAGFLYVD